MGNKGREREWRSCGCGALPGGPMLDFVPRKAHVAILGEQSWEAGIGTGETTKESVPGAMGSHFPCLPLGWP